MYANLTGRRTTRLKGVRKPMSKIRIAIAGLGNCESSLVQGIYYYRSKQPEDAIGMMHWDIGGFTPVISRW
jgi:myo-inositol-1-phosphate synthase